MRKIRLKLLNQLRKSTRYLFCLKYKRRIKNTNFSLITNNCIAGLLYHDLNMRFNSPTVNLFILAKDYILLLSDINYYLSANLSEVKEPGLNYPVGTLGEGSKVITIHFLHYHSFEEASTLWRRRVERINFENMYVVAEYLKEEGWNEGLLQTFCQLPFNNKKILIPMIEKKYITIHSDNIVYIKGTNYANWSKGTWRIWRKGYDGFAIIDWLNK